jgi:hypothetical protein
VCPRTGTRKPTAAAGCGSVVGLAALGRCSDRYSVPMVSPAAPRRVGLPALLPYLREHRRTLALVALLSLISAGAALAQPLLVRTVLDGITAGRAVAGPVTALIGLLLVGAALNGRSPSTTGAAPATCCPGWVRTPPCCGRW